VKSDGPNFDVQTHFFAKNMGNGINDKKKRVGPLPAIECVSSLTAHHSFMSVCAPKIKFAGKHSFNWPSRSRMFKIAFLFIISCWTT
jgi:hypothetical protein